MTEQRHLEQQRLDVQRKDFYQFLKQENEELQKHRTETNETYKKVKSVVARLAAANNYDAVRAGDDRTTFDEMYSADLIGVEGPQLESAMVQFSRALEMWEQSGTKPDDMQQLSLMVSKACTVEIAEMDSQIDDLKVRISKLLRGDDYTNSAPQNKAVNPSGASGGL